MRTLVVSLTLVAATACGQSQSEVGAAAAEPPFTSGERLRARVFDGGDGAVAVYEWHDAELDTACGFRVASDGAYRCLPWTRDARASYTRTDVVYLDAGCSEAVVLFKADAALPEYTLGDPEVVPCTQGADRYPAHRVGEVVPELTRETYYRDGSLCRWLGPVSLSASSLTAARLGEVVPPEVFVAAERVPTKSSERLSPIDLQGADGSRERVGVWDSEEPGECVPLWGDGAPCVPPRVAWYVDDFFTDGSCTEPQAYVSGASPLNGGAGIDPSCPPPEVAVRSARSGGVCSDFAYTFHRVGSAATSSYRLEAGVCSSADDPMRLEFEVGEQLPQGSFATIRNTTVGGGRLKLEVVATSGGARLDVGGTRPDSGAFDSKTRSSARLARRSSLAAGSCFAIRSRDSVATSPTARVPIPSCCFLLPRSVPSQARGSSAITAMGEAVGTARCWSWATPSMSRKSTSNTREVIAAPKLRKAASRFGLW
jgi:hypothetical protein